MVVDPESLLKEKKVENFCIANQYYFRGTNEEKK